MSGVYQPLGNSVTGAKCVHRLSAQISANKKCVSLFSRILLKSSGKGRIVCFAEDGLTSRQILTMKSVLRRVVDILLFLFVVVTLIL